MGPGPVRASNLRPFANDSLVDEAFGSNGGLRDHCKDFFSRYFVVITVYILVIPYRPQVAWYCLINSVNVFSTMLNTIINKV